MTTFATAYAAAVAAVEKKDQPQAERCIAEARALAERLDAEIGEALMVPIIERAEALARLVFVELKDPFAAEVAP